MERVSINQAKELFGDNFIGVEELFPLFKKLGLNHEDITIPEINYSLELLENVRKDYILILGIPKIEDKNLSILLFRHTFGIDPNLSEPCFYNQDWYMNEDFIHDTLELQWYLLKKNVIEDSRAVQPNELQQRNIKFPSAILCVYTFFAYYFSKGRILWYHDFIWCSDTDHNGDRIYVGKYHDIDGINKNGFSIHRHLALRNCYATISVIQ